MKAPKHCVLECPVCEADLYVEINFTAYPCNCTDRHNHAHVAVTHNAEHVVVEHNRLQHKG